MDHVVYLDKKAKELEKLFSGEKTMIVRGATGRKLPYGRVNIGDILYFVQNNAELLVQAKSQVKSVFNSEKMTENESQILIEKNQPKLQLSDKQLERWSGKRYLVLVEVGKMEEIPPFSVDKTNFGNMDDWLLVEDIEKVILLC